MAPPGGTTLLPADEIIVAETAARGDDHDNRGRNSGHRGRHSRNVEVTTTTAPRSQRHQHRRGRGASLAATVTVEVAAAAVEVVVAVMTGSLQQPRAQIDIVVNDVTVMYCQYYYVSIITYHLEYCYYYCFYYCCYKHYYYAPGQCRKACSLALDRSLGTLSLTGFTTRGHFAAHYLPGQAARRMPSLASQSSTAMAFAIAIDNSDQSNLNAVSMAPARRQF